MGSSIPTTLGGLETEFTAEHLTIVVTSSIALGWTIFALAIGIMSLRKRRNSIHSSAVVIAVTSALSICWLLAFCIVQILLMKSALGAYWSDKILTLCFPDRYRPIEEGEVFGKSNCDNLDLTFLDEYPIYGVGRGYITKEKLHTFRPVVEELLTLLSDFIIVWRANAMHPGQRSITILLVVLWIICLGLAVCATIPIAKYIPEASWSFMDIASLYMPFAFTGISFVTNLVATALVASKLRSYRKFIKQNLGVSKAYKTKPQRILFLLVESGCVYCLVQGTFFIYSLVPWIRSRASITLRNITLFQHIVYLISGFYPVMIYILVGVQLRKGGSAEVVNLASTGAR